MKTNIDTQVYALVSTIYEIYEELEPYDPKFPDPEIISAVVTMVEDFKNGYVDCYIDILAEYLENIEKNENVYDEIRDVIEDLKQLKADTNS